MGDGAAQAPLRVLIVDEEEAVRDILSAELSAAGYEVDTLSSGNGFSEDMVSLIRPDLLLVNPFLPDVPVEAVGKVLTALHGDGAFKLVLIDGGEDPGKLAQLAAACRADGAISKHDLLRAPADAVAEQFLPEAEVMEVVEEEPRLPDADAAHEEGIEIVLSAEPPRKRPPARPAAARSSGSNLRAGKSAALRAGARPPPGRPQSQPPARSTKPSAVPRASASGRVLEMIQNEVGPVPKAPPKALPGFHVEISLFSRHNFYVGPTGDLRTGGIFIATPDLPAVGDWVKLRIQLPSVPPLDTEGPVEWVRQGSQLARVTPGAGVSLAHLPPDWRSALERFFRERAPLAYLPTAGR
jgi:CheY-like chemotaxis protein/Tfp pilus assembly protein PilZ